MDWLRRYRQFCGTNCRVLSGPRHSRQSEWCASHATRHIALVRSIDVDKPGHDTMAFTALPRYSSAISPGRPWRNGMLLRTLGSLFCTLLFAAHAGAATCGGDFNAFLSAMAREPDAAGVSRSVLDSAFAGLMPDGAVLAFDRRQRGTFRKSFEEYAATRVIPARIKRAKQLMQRHADALRLTIEPAADCGRYDSIRKIA